MIIIKNSVSSGLMSGNSVWKWSTYLLGVIFFLLSVRWSLLDKSPPAWDQGMYLFQASTLFESFKTNGFYNFVVSIFNIDKGRVPLLLVVVQPAFFVFGPSLDAAVISLNAFWFLLMWSIVGISRQISVEPVQNKAGFFSFTLFSFYPLTMLLAHNYLVELMLVALVSASLYSLVMLHQTQRQIWSLSAGFLIGCGLLTKVTFPAFVFPSFLFILLSHAKKQGINSTARVFWLAATLPLIVAGPYYIHNIKEILQLTTLLSSHGLSQMYGFRAALDPIAIMEYLWVVFTNPVMVISFLCIGLSLLVAFVSSRNLKKFEFLDISDRNIWLIVMAIWFFIPLVLATLGEIKEPRYIYPALIPIFVLAGVSACRLNFRVIGFGLMLIFYAMALPAYLRVNDFLSGEKFDFFRISSGLTTDSLIDEREWKIDTLVQEIAAGVPVGTKNNGILFLGGNRYYHMRLLDYYGLIQGVSLRYFALPYYANPNMTIEEALKFIDDQAPDGIISKGGQNWPEFSSRLDSAIIDKLNNNSNYVRNELKTVQPDGSKFTYFVRKLPEYFHAKSDEVFSGVWVVDNGMAKITIGDQGKILITTETGVQSTASVQDGGITVPAWSVSAQITKDLKELHWSNGSKWKKLTGNQFPLEAKNEKI